MMSHKDQKEFSIAYYVTEAELGPWGLSYYLLHFSLCIETQLTAHGTLVAFTLICICPTPFLTWYLTLTSPACLFIYTAAYIAAPSVRAPSVCILR